MKPKGTIPGAAGFRGQNPMKEGGVVSVWKDSTPKVAISLTTGVRTASSCSLIASSKKAALKSAS